MSVANAIEPREVRARLGRRDDVVDGHRVLGVRQRHLDELRARLFALRKRLLGDALHLWIEALDVEILLRDAEPNALHRRALKRSCVIRDGVLGGRAVHLVVACERAEKYRRVLDRLRHGAHLVERARERRYAVAAHAPIARLHADAVAETRRLADRPARVGAERRDAEIPANRSRATAGAAAWNAPKVVGVARHAKTRVLSGRAHRELVHVDAPCGNEVVRLHVLDNRCVIRRDIALQDLRRTGARLASDIDQVLDRDRHRLRVRAGELKRLLLVEGEIRADFGVLRMVAVDDRLRQID